MISTIIVIISLLVALVILSSISYNGILDYKDYKDIINNSIRGKYYTNKKENELVKSLLYKLSLFILLLTLMLIVVFNYISLINF